jgi:hypothetical protein
MSAINMMELAAYSTDSVIHMITAKAKMPSMCWPATDRPVGCGNMMMATSAAAPAANPHVLMKDVDDFADGVPGATADIGGIPWRGKLHPL